MSSFINDCNWAEVPHRTRNDRSQLLLDRQSHSGVHSTNQRRNCIDSAVEDLPMVDLENLAVDYSSTRDTDTGPNWNSLRRIDLDFEVDQRRCFPDCLSDRLMEFDLGRRNFLAEDRLAKWHSTPRRTMDRRNRTNEDRLE